MSDTLGKEEAILELIAERDKLKEEREKYINLIYNLQATFDGLALNYKNIEYKLENAVKLASFYIKEKCERCTSKKFIKRDPLVECKGICAVPKSVEIIEKLTGKSWEELAK